MPGPPPKDPRARRRRNLAPELLKLPERHTAKPPPWPLLVTPPEWAERGLDKIERKEWAELWATPHAAAWARLGHGVAAVVARYVRFRILADLGDAKAGAEARLLEDRLGISSMAMKRLGWTVADDELAERRASSPALAQPRSRAKAKSTDPRRVRAVDPSA